MKVDEFCGKLAQRLASRTERVDRIEAAVSAIGSAFGVSSHEVAIFACDAASESLTFLWPVPLRSSGAIPVTAHKSLVANTVREKRASLNNAFSSTPHASFFEQFRRNDAELSQPIQKIMSVPLLKDGQVCWVIQVSRKGATPAAAGRDFSPAELAALERIGQVIALHI